MAEFEETTAPGGTFSKRVFRRAPVVTAVSPDKEEFSGRGFLSALRKETDEPGGKPHPLGLLSRPVYHFIGWLPGLTNCKGGVMTQAGVSYTVLDVRRVTLGDCELCMRALLERRDDDDCE